MRARSAAAFQSTHPVWDGTEHNSSVGIGIGDFNPPIPCGMGLSTFSGARMHGIISIHPSRVGWDSATYMASFSLFTFQSTHPVWDGTCTAASMSAQPANFNPPIPCGMGLSINGNAEVAPDISIHPSRVGWDSTRTQRQTAIRDFNPPIPCGMGLWFSWLVTLLTLISIHPSRVGWDVRAVVSIFRI